MFTKHQSQAEMDQWHQACTSATMQAHGAPHQTTARAATAKGQGERNAAHRDAQTMSSMPMQTPDDWASECMFDWYNS